MTKFQLVTTSPVQTSLANLWVAYGVLGKSAKDLEDVDFSYRILTALRDVDVSTLSEKGQQLYRDVLLRNEDDSDSYTQIDRMLDNMGQDYVDLEHLLTNNATTAFAKLQEAVSPDVDVGLTTGFLYFDETPELILEVFTHVIEPVMRQLEPNLVILQATVSQKLTQQRDWVV